MGDFWQNLYSRGAGLAESVGESLSGGIDAFVDFKVQELAEKQANPQQAALVEPIKGTTVAGKPIVVPNSSAVEQANAGTIAGMNTTTLLIVGGSLVAALAIVAIKGR